MHISLGNPCKPHRLENLCGATNFMGIKLQRNKLSHRHTHTHTHGAEHQKNTENAIEVKSTRKISGKKPKNERPLNSLGWKRRRSSRRRRNGNASGLRNEKSQMRTGNWQCQAGNRARAKRQTENAEANQSIWQCVLVSN